MKYSGFIVSLLITITAFAQSDTLNRIDTAGKKQGYWIVIGKMQKDRIYTDSAKVEEGNYVNSMKTGLWLTYYPSGIKKMELTYVNNRASGPCIVYYENGHKQEEGTWQGTRWIGDYKMYYENDSLREHFIYSNTGIRDGAQSYGEWNLHPKAIEVEMKPVFPGPINGADSLTIGSGEGEITLSRNGKIYQKGTFKNYKLIDGEERIYDVNGNLIQRKLYKEGKYVGDGPIPADANQ